jgi:pimeloyl-ACP methyl ester carboxylesterase
LVKAANWITHLEHVGKSPVWRHWIDEFSRAHTYVQYDERGCGLSDWEVGDFRFDAWVNDLETVVDHLGLERFPLIGISQGGPVAIAYAAQHPERVSHLILYGTYAKGWAMGRLSADEIEEQEALIKLSEQGWGRDTHAYRQLFTNIFMPDANEDEIRSFTELQRVSTSPANAGRFQREFGQIDVSDLLPDIKVPTLIMHAKGDARVPFELGRQLSADIPNSKFVPLDSRNHVLVGSEPAWNGFVREIYEFLDVDLEPLPVQSMVLQESPQSSESAAHSWFSKLRRRRLIGWPIGYLAVGWILLQVIDVVSEPWNLANWVSQLAQILLVVGLLITIVVAVLRDGYLQRQARRKNRSAEQLNNRT